MSLLALFIVFSYWISIQPDFTSEQVMDIRASWRGEATVRRVSADASSAEKYNYEESAHVQDYVESHVRGV